MSKRIRFAIVGLGHIGKRHALEVEAHPGAELVAVCDVLSPAELNWQNGELPFFYSISELLQSDCKPDVVTICTPNGLHASQALLVLEASCNVLVEKPMALSVAEAEEMLQKAEQVDKSVFVVMQNRYSPPVIWLKQLVCERVLGDIFLVQMNCFWNRDNRYYQTGSWHGTCELDGGVLFTQFSHFIDIMYWLFGDVCNFRGQFRNFNHQHSTCFEDSGSVTFDFVKEGMGNLTYSTAVWNRNLESSITVIAANGSVQLSGQYMDRVAHCHVLNYQMPDLEPVNPPNDYGGFQGSASNHAAMIDGMIKILNGEAAISVPGREGKKVVEIIENIYKLRGPGEAIR